MNCLAFLAMSMCKDPNWVDDLFEDVNDMDGPVAEECVDTSLDAALVGDTAKDSRFTLCTECPVDPKGIAFGDFPSVELELLAERQVFEPMDSSSNPVINTLLAPNNIVEFQSVGVVEVPETGFAKRVTLVEVSQHRRVHKHQRGRFVASITSEIKAKMGIPAKSKANDLTIRYLANGRCKELGVRPKHSQAIVELVLVMVYTPDDCDVAASELTNSCARKAAWDKYSWANKSLLYRAFMPKFFHNLSTHGPADGPVSA